MNYNPEHLKNLKLLSKTLDSKFEGPFGTRYGLDPLIGLIPGFGDIVTSGLSFYIILAASKIGVDSATLLRMGLNLLIDNMFAMIPILGNAFDFYWKANNKNMALLEKHLANPSRETIKSRMVVGLLGIMLILFLAFSLFATYKIFEALFHLIFSS